MTWFWKLGVNSNDAVTIYPLYGYKHGQEKIESEHRTMAGDLYRYKWGDFYKFNVPVSFVTSADQATINNWWENNTKLQWMLVNEFNNNLITNGDFSYDGDWTKTPMDGDVYIQSGYLELAQGVATSQWVRVSQLFDVTSKEQLLVSANKTYESTNTTHVYVGVKDDDFATALDAYVTWNAGETGVKSEVLDVSTYTGEIYLICTNAATFGITIRLDDVSVIEYINNPIKEIYPVNIVGNEKPIDQFVKPYMQYYKGTIKLESY